MSKEIGTVRPGTHVKTITGGRVRHTRVLSVTDQDTIAALVGYAGNATSASFTASRVESTQTRATIFEQD